MVTDRTDQMEQNNETANVTQTCIAESGLYSHTNYELWRVAILGILFAIGAPANTLTFYRLVRRVRITHSTSRIMLLNLNLNISDLLVIYTYVIGEIAWAISLKFSGGRFLCKIYKFSNALAFSISSFVVVAISLDRLICLVFPLKTRSEAKRHAKQMLVAAWLFGFGCAIPQAFTWDIVYPCPTETWFAQCSSTFTIEPYLIGLEMQANYNWTKEQVRNSTEFQDKWNTVLLNQRIYALIHVATVFLVPFIIIATSYAGILHQVLTHLGSQAWNAEATTATTTLSGERGASSTSSDHPITPKTINTTIEMTIRRTGSGGHSRQKPTASNEVQSRRASLATTPAGQLRIQRAKTRTLRTTLFIVLAYLLCWLPYNVLLVRRIAQGLQDVDQDPKDDYWNLLYMVIILNSVINPFLYGWYTAQLGKFFHQLYQPGKYCCGYRRSQPKTGGKSKRHAYFAGDMLQRDDNGQRRYAHRQLYT